MGWQYLELKIDAKQFAPSKEQVALNYVMPRKGRLTRVRLQVLDFQDATLFEEEHACDTGLPNLVWNGARNRGPNLPAEPFATPLRSPYRIVVHGLVVEEEKKRPSPDQLSTTKARPRTASSCATDETSGEEPEPKSVEPVADEPVTGKPRSASVAVLYHSLELVRGPWVATGEVLVVGSDGWKCERLNALGYSAGPPLAVDPEYLRKATARYNATRDTTVHDLQAALLAGDNSQPWLHYNGQDVAADTSLSGRDLRLFVEAIGYSANHAHGVDELRDQYTNAATRKGTVEAAKLNRPLLPIEAVIYLKGRDGSRVDAPEAVGAVRVDWHVLDLAEDTGRLPANDRTTHSYPRKFIEAAYARLGAKKRDRNCPRDLGGIYSDADHWKDAFWPGGAYAPYQAQRDNADRVVFVPANVDRQAARAVGRAGVLLHPSFVAGDRYRVHAALNFKGRPNEKKLAKDNRKIEDRTGTIEIWRRAVVAAVLGWPSRAELSGATWAAVQRELAYAYLEVDASAVASLPIDQLLDDNDYKDWVDFAISGLPKFTTDPMYAALDLHINPAAVINPAPAGDGADLATRFSSFRTLANALFNNPKSVPNQPKPEKGQERFVRTLLAKGRARWPRGYLIVTLGVHDLITAELDHVGMTAKETFNVPCSGERDLLVTLWNARPENLDYVLAHEMAHCLWLRHHENAGDSDLPELKGDHDQSDHCCTMSYPVSRDPRWPHQLPDRYAPHFCGKCNLKLRGWDVQSDRLPKAS